MSWAWFLILLKWCFCFYLQITCSSCWTGFTFFFFFKARKFFFTCQNGEGLPIRVHVRGSKSFRAESKSKPACLHRRGAREKSGILNISIRIFLTLPEERVQLNTCLEKKVGVTGHFEIFFSKNKPLLSRCWISRRSNPLSSVSSGLPTLLIDGSYNLPAMFADV